MAAVPHFDSEVLFHSLTDGESIHGFPVNANDEERTGFGRGFTGPLKRLRGRVAGVPVCVSSETDGDVEVGLEIEDEPPYDVEPELWSAGSGGTRLRGYVKAATVRDPLPLCLSLLLCLCTGCGSNQMTHPDCSVAPNIDVAPQSATADHAAATPGNTTSFVGADGTPNGCLPTPGAIRLDLKWSVSDTTNATIGNTPNVDYGVAKCINAAPAPITVTATAQNRLGQTISGTASLTCK